LQQLVFHEAGKHKQDALEAEIKSALDGVAYRAIGVRVDEQGVLREAFALIPLGYLTGTAALVNGTAALITGQRRRRNEEP
jgi:hypothetical protein